MKQILNLCYNDLPPRLRTYLLYLSTFPENYEVDTARLVRLCITERFFLEIHGAEVKMDHNELISRNLMQSLHWNHDDIPRYCRLHPVIHDFLVCKSMEEKFATVVKDQGDQIFPINNGTVHRVSLQSNSIRVQAVLRNDSVDLSRARSISVFGQASSTLHLTDLKVVRVLDLEGYDGPVCLDGLSTLVLLRYLSLRGTGVSELPATIGELRCLETLDVSSTKVKKLPASIGVLLCLRYLNIRDTDVSELPATIGGLRLNLKVILVGGKGRFNSVETVTRLPNAIQHCQCLEKLGTIDLRVHHASFVKALGGLDRLRVLKITWSSQQSNEKAYREALVSSMENWTKLKSLTIHCGFLCSLEFLGSLPNPPLQLKKFKVTAGRFTVIPQWIRGLGLLSFLQITVCKLGSDDLRILKDLPSLKFLILGLEFIPSADIEIENEGFKELTRFSVDCPVPWLTFSTEAMPKLTYLQLKFCSGPAGPGSVPSGISNLRSLTEVVLCYNEKWCANSSSVKMAVASVKKEVAKHRNTIELIINDIRENVQQAEEATEVPNIADPRGKAKVNVEVVGEGTSKTSSLEIEEIIEDDAEHRL
jgi:Leucine-rich repeat (LRR) protein